MTLATEDSLDWANMCRQYRLRFGLKQEAFASDFNVSQSTVSRWENGDRVPGRKAQRRLLEAMPARPASPLPTQLADVITGGAMATVLWNRSGVLLECSESFLDEIRRVGITCDPIGKHADELFDNQGMMHNALCLFEEFGFFDGHVVSASVVSEPVGNPTRRQAGGSVITQVHPTLLPDNSIGMLCYYHHDVLRKPPAGFEITVHPAGSANTIERHFARQPSLMPHNPE